MPLTPSERTMRARLAAYTKHALHDPVESTEAARAAFMQKFIDEVDPDRVLPEAERNRRAAAARKAHFQRLAFLSAKARRKGSEAGDE